MIIELFIASLIAFGVMFLTWIYYLATKNPGIVDVSWGLGITFCGLWYLYNSIPSDKQLLLAVLILVWGLRLSGFLWYTRIKPKHIDPRYLDIAKSWSVKKDLGFLGNFMLQAFLLSFIALPFFFINNYTFNTIDFVACGFVIIGILGETIADYQLYSFRKKKKSKLCNVGFWKYSRHPNYFFEVVVWFGFSTFAISSINGFYAFISPLMLIYIMIFLTIPITERNSIKSKGKAFKDYQKSTSRLIPWLKFKKKR